MRKLKSLVFFIQQVKVKLLYRDFYKLLYKRVPDQLSRNEFRQEIRGQFEIYKNLDDDKKIEYLLAEGRGRLSQFKNMIK